MRVDVGTKHALQLARQGWRFTAPGARSPFDDPIEYRPDEFCQSLSGNHYLVMRNPGSPSLRAYSPAYVVAADHLFGEATDEPRLAEFKQRLPEVGGQIALQGAVALLGSPGLAVDQALAQVEFSRGLDRTITKEDNFEVKAAEAFQRVGQSVEGTGRRQREEIYLKLYSGIADNFRPETYRQAVSRTTEFFEKVMATGLREERLGQVTEVMAALTSRLSEKDWDLALKVTSRAARGPRWSEDYLQLMKLKEVGPVDDMVRGLQGRDRVPIEIRHDTDAVWIGSVCLELD